MYGLWRIILYFMNPYTVAFVCVFLMATVWLFFRSCKRFSRLRAAVFSLAFLFTVGIVFMTLLRDIILVIAYLLQSEVEYHLDWSGWWRWQTERFMEGEFTAEIQANILLFIPATFLWGLFTKRPYVTFWGAVGFSAFVESFQGLTQVGVQDLMDFVSNSFGAFLGALAAAWILAIFHPGAVARWKRIVLVGAVTVVSFGTMFSICAMVEGKIRKDLSKNLVRDFAGTSARDYFLWEENGLFGDKFMSYPVSFNVSDSDKKYMIHYYPTNFFFVNNCQAARWSETDFETFLTSRDNCDVRNYYR